MTGAVPRVLLVNMPFASLTLPSLSASLLQGVLRQGGMECDTRHLGFELARRLGPDHFETLAVFGPKLGEWLFVPAAHGGPLVDDEDEHIRSLLARWRPADQVDRWHTDLLAERAICTEFVDWAFAAVDWAAYDVVGFTCMFQQNLASVALARRIKQHRPDLPILAGGANFQGEMGAALHEAFECFDLVCTGEGDEIVVGMVDAALGRRDPATVPGIVYRSGTRSVDTGPAPLVHDLDALPIPDFDDWLADRERAGLTGRRWRMLAETARGCWWGARSHCTFCGLNGRGMTFRSKSAPRALAELRALRDRYDKCDIEIIDNILDMRYFRTLLPHLAAEVPPFELFWELKASVTHEQVRLLAAAGVTEVLPGIESFSDHVLDLMAKGTTGLQNVQFLKWCREFGIEVHWNYLHGFPGETVEDYTSVVPLIEAVSFLQPPRAVQLAMVDRFSPMHEDPQSVGIASIRPNPVYRLLYPVDEDHMTRLAYDFDPQHEGGFDPDVAVAPIINLLRRWMESPAPPGLWMHTADDGSVSLADDRPSSGRPLRTTLRGWRAEVYTACDRVRPRDELHALPASEGVEAADVEKFLAWCLERRLMVRDGDRLLAIAVHTPARAEPHRAPTRTVRSIPVAAARP